MSETLAQIKAKLREIVGGSVTIPLSCEVVSIQGTSCTVKIAGGLELPDVRLRATISNSTDELLITPKEGSKALVWSVTGTLEDLVLLKCDQIAKITYKQGDLEFGLDSATQKVTIKNNTTSLGDLMNELHDIITNLKVTTPSGPSTGVLPDTTASLLQFKTNFQQLLN